MQEEIKTVLSTVPVTGYRIIWLDDDGIVFEQNILAFAIAESRPNWADSPVSWVLPVTCEEIVGIDRAPQQYAILEPDGRVTEPELQTYDSVQSFVAALHERRKKRLTSK